MKKKNQSSEKFPKKEKNSKESKPKGLFDHLNAIRISKNPDYYDSLTEKEKNGFNHWMILYGLSMDNTLIPMVSELWKEGFYDKMPSKAFYKLLIELVPYSDKRLFWIKKPKENKKLLECISKWYLISNRESEYYLKILLKSEQGLKELADIFEGLGLTDKEAENILMGEKEEE